MLQLSIHNFFFLVSIFFYSVVSTGIIGFSNVPETTELPGNRVLPVVVLKVMVFFPLKMSLNFSNGTGIVSVRLCVYEYLCVCVCPRLCPCVSVCVFVSICVSVFVRVHDSSGASFALTYYSFLIRSTLVQLLHLVETLR